MSRLMIVEVPSYSCEFKGIREVAELVRCRECKYYEAKEDWCYWRDEAITADDFCSYGVRDSEKPNNSKERSSE